MDQCGKNKWRLVVYVGRNENGKQVKKVKTVTALSKHKAEELLEQFVTKLKN